MGEFGDVRLEPGDMAATGRAARRACCWVLGREEVAVPGVVAGRETGHQQPPAAAVGQPGRTGSRIGAVAAGADQQAGWQVTEWASGGLSRWFLVLKSFNSNILFGGWWPARAPVVGALRRAQEWGNPPMRGLSRALVCFRSVMKKLG